VTLSPISGNRLIQFRLAAPCDVDERTFLSEALGGGETYSAAATGDDGNFSFEVWHLSPLYKLGMFTGWERRRFGLSGDRCARRTVGERSAGLGVTTTFGPSGNKSAETSVAMKSRLKISAAERARAAVLAHLGPTIASGWMFAPELESGEVRPVLTNWKLPPLDL
jgi:hypothetical protein